MVQLIRILPEIKRILTKIKRKYLTFTLKIDWQSSTDVHTSIHTSHMAYIAKQDTVGRDMERFEADRQYSYYHESIEHNRSLKFSIGTE